MYFGRRLLPLRAVLVCCAAILAGSGQVDPRAALLERAGFDALDAGRIRDAVDAFREGVAADPKNARLHLGAGLAAAMQQRDGEARAALERAIGLDPKLTPARVLLGQIQHRMGDGAAAIRTYQALLVETPDNPEVQAAIDRWQREIDLHTRMQLAIGAHFTVSFEGPAEAALASEAIEVLDRAYWRIGEVLGTFPTDPIPVVLYTAEQFRDITRSPSWAAGAYDGTIRVPMRGALDNPSELDRVLSHEFTHALIRTLAARGVPMWLNEGLAAALEQPDLTWARKAAGSGSGIPLRALQSGFGRLNAAEAQRAYGLSALAVRRLLDDVGGFAIANLLRDLGSGEPFDSAFLHRTSQSFTDFQAALY